MSIGNEGFDILEFIEAFRQCLSTPDASQETKLKEMMAKYSALCDEANARLRECAGLSQKGLYANAVSSAERDPNLMDRCSLLEIPERDILSTVATALGISAPSLLNRDLIEILQETYQKGATAEGNVRILHRLTLARAPLPTRLTIMRRLQIQDPNRPFIDADIRTFEKAWFKKAIDFSQPFAKAGNVQVLEEILSDLRENGYLETPPAQLIAGVQSLLAKARGLQLPVLAQEIQQAFKAGAIDVLLQLAARWKTLVANSGVADAAAKYQVAEALTWLQKVSSDRARDAEIKNSRSRLTELLANPKSSKQDVTNAFQTAQQLRAIDGNLDAKYESWMLSQRKRPSVFAGAAAGIFILLVVVGGVGYVVHSGFSEQQRMKTDLVNHLNDLIQQRNYKAVLDAVEESDSAVADDPRVVELKKLASDRILRSPAFETALRRLKSARRNEDWESLGKDALKVARDDRDRQQVEELLADLRGNSEPKLPNEKDEFERRLAKVERDASQLSQELKDGRSSPKNDTATAELRKQISDLRGIAGGHNWDIARLDRVETVLKNAMTANHGGPAPTKPNNPPPKDDKDDVATQLAKFSSEMSTAMASDDTLIKTADFLTSRLASAHSDDRTKRRAQEAKQDLAHWQKTLKLKDLFEGGRVNAQVRKEWVGKPPMSAIDASVGAMEMLQQRDFSDSNSEAFKLKTRLLAADIKDVYLIRTELAEPYCYWYTKEALDAGEEPVEWKIITDVDGGSIKQKIRGKRKASVLSPQSRLLPDWEKLWSPATGAGQWHQQLADAYERLAEDNDIEPLLKLQLMRRMLKLASASSVGYRQLLENLANYKTISGASGILNGNWFDPKNVMYEQRAKATSICEAAPRLSKLATEAESHDATELQKARGAINLIGHVQQSVNKQPTVTQFFTQASVGRSKLYVISEGAWIAIGSSDSNDKIQLEPAANQFLGWPVFSVRNVDSAQ